MAVAGEKIEILISAATEPLRRGLAEADRAIGQTRSKIDRELGSIDRRFAQIGSSIRGALGAVGIGLSVGALAQDLMRTTLQFEKLDARMRRLIGSAGAFADAQDYLREAANRLNVPIADLTDQYAQLLTLQNAGLVTQQEARNLLEGFADVAAATGASTQQLNQVMYGLGQALSSGVVRAEELNQVTEPLPGLMQELDKAAGLAAGGFRKMVNDGQVTSRFFAETLVKALKAYEGSAVSMSDTVGAALVRLDNAWTDLKRSLSEPLADVLTPFLQTVFNAVEWLKRTAAEARQFTAPERARAREDLQKAREQLETRKAIEDGKINLPGIPSREFLERRIAALERLLNQGQGPGDFPTFTPPPAPLATPAPPSAKAKKTRTAKTDAEREAEAVERVTEALRHQEAQLTRNERQAFIYQQLQAAGIDVNHELAGRVVDAALAFLEMQDAVKAVDGELDALLREDPFGLFGTRAEEAADKVKKVKEVAGAAERAGRDFAFTLSSAFEDAMDRGEGLRGVLQGILQDLAKIAAREAFLNPFSDALSGLFRQAGSWIGGSLFGGGSLPGGSGTDFISLPGRASGGPVAAGTAYMVGERGREIFVPQVPGTIIPNHALGAMGGSDVAVQIIDQRGAGAPPVETTQTRGPDGKTIIRALVRREVQEGIASGAFDRTLGQTYGLRRQGRA